MAKIHKVTTYIVDPNGIYEDWNEMLLNLCLEDVYFTTAKAEQKSFEWDDELPINFNKCPLNEFEKYFSS
jgi:hypothetical protein